MHLMHRRALQMHLHAPVRQQAFLQFGAACELQLTRHHGFVVTACIGPDLRGQQALFLQQRANGFHPLA